MTWTVLAEVQPHKFENTPFTKCSVSLKYFPNSLREFGRAGEEKQLSFLLKM